MYYSSEPHLPVTSSTFLHLLSCKLLLCTSIRLARLAAFKLSPLNFHPFLFVVKPMTLGPHISLSYSCSSRSIDSFCVGRDLHDVVGTLQSYPRYGSTISFLIHTGNGLAFSSDLSVKTTDYTVSNNYVQPIFTSQAITVDAI